MPELQTKLVFGAVSIGLAYGLPRAPGVANQAPSDADVELLVDRALALGITTFDTAPAYGDSERRLGRVLGSRGRVWTKVTAGDPSASLAASLEHLQRPHVELLQWHNWTAPLGRDEAWVAAWRRLRGDARVAQLGATTYGVADAVAAVDSGLFDVVQCEFNLLRQSVVTALAGRITTAVRSVLLQGALTDEGRVLPALPALRAGVDRVRAVSPRVTRLALRAALEHPAIAHVLVGIDRVAQLDEAVAIATGDPLSATERAAIATLDLGDDPASDPRTWK